jgi:hypothetical protein
LGRFGLFHHCTKVDAKLDEHVPLRHILGAFRAVSLLLESRCKLAELVPLTHKFAKQGRITIFRNGRTRSIPLDPKLMFWGVSDHFDTARKSMKN